MRPSGPGELTSRTVRKGLVSRPQGETSTGKIVKSHLRWVFIEPPYMYWHEGASLSRFG